MKNLFLSAIFGFLVTFTYSPIAEAQQAENGECPEGKAPITITTPSGKTKNLCVANSAIPGLENAGEHSAADIVPAQCPCFSQSEAEALIGIDAIAYQNNKAVGVDGTADACELVKIRSANVELGASKSLVDPPKYCWETVEYPLGEITPNGCVKYLKADNTVLKLVPIEPDEGAACVAILKTFDPSL